MFSTYRNDFIGGTVHHLEKLQNETRRHIAASATTVAGRRSDFLRLAAAADSAVGVHCPSTSSSIRSIERSFVLLEREKIEEAARFCAEHRYFCILERRAGPVQDVK